MKRVESGTPAVDPRNAAWELRRLAAFADAGDALVQRKLRDLKAAHADAVALPGAVDALAQALTVVGRYGPALWRVWARQHHGHAAGWPTVEDRRRPRAV